jgi:glyoxylase-like metal-dependent hydrolase (beta-lactamase superfamily II)
MIFKQLFDPETWTFTYLIAAPVSKEAVFIDPVNTHIDGYITLLEKYGLQLKYSLETHVYADHITASGLLRQRLGAQTAVSQLCGAETADVQIQDGDFFKLGASEEIKVIATPGHTRGSISFLWRDRVFTGDSLFIGGCGRTDFQGGDGVRFMTASRNVCLPCRMKHWFIRVMVIKAAGLAAPCRNAQPIPVWPEKRASSLSGL